MKGSLEIYELKILKGPDRLMRIHIIISETIDLKASINILGMLVDSLIWKHHNLQMVFPADQLFDAIPEDKNKFGTKPGEFFNGKLGVEILINKKTESIFNLRFYPEDLEFERHVSSVDSYLAMQKIKMEDYEFKYTLGNLSAGFPRPTFTVKINFLN